MPEMPIRAVRWKTFPSGRHLMVLEFLDTSLKPDYRVIEQHGLMPNATLAEAIRKIRTTETAIGYVKKVGVVGRGRRHVFEVRIPERPDLLGKYVRATRGECQKVPTKTALKYPWGARFPGGVNWARWAMIPMEEAFPRQPIRI